MGSGDAAASVDYGGIEIAYQQLGGGGVIARGRGRGTDFSELAKIKRIQTPRAL